MQTEFDLEEKRKSEAQRYTRRNILRSEFMYGRGFQSPGGFEAVAAFCARLALRPGMRALEVGSGLGGSAMYLARQHGLDVTGLDVCQAMVDLSDERRVEDAVEGVRFVQGDVRSYPLPEEHFDLVWTRDCVLYVPEKYAVWQSVARCLKSGGQLFITDFARGPGALSPSFRKYLDACDYHLQTLDLYAGALEAVGLQVDVREDATAAFVAGLQQEKERLAAAREAFLSQYEQADYDYLMERWDQKIAFCLEGDMRWGLFVARKV